MTLEWHESVEQDGTNYREFTIHASGMIAGVLWPGPDT